MMIDVCSARNRATGGSNNSDQSPNLPGMPRRFARDNDSYREQLWGLEMRFSGRGQQTGVRRTVADGWFGPGVGPPCIGLSAPERVRDRGRWSLNEESAESPPQLRRRRCPALPRTGVRRDAACPGSFCARVSRRCAVPTEAGSPHSVRAQRRSPGIPGVLCASAEPGFQRRTPEVLPRPGMPQP